MGETRLKGSAAASVETVEQQHGEIGDCRVDGNIAKIASSGRKECRAKLPKGDREVQAGTWPRSPPARA